MRHRPDGRNAGRVALQIGLAAMVIAAGTGVAVLLAGGGGASKCSAVGLSLVADVTASDVASLNAGYQFLDAMMDQHATGTTRRLPQSYTGGFLQKDGFTDSVTYDDALIIDALLARGTADDIARAKVLGDSLLYVQANDTKADGRIRAAYGPAPLTSASTVMATDPTTDVGNMAWVGQALLHLYARAGGPSYLDGALKLANWIQKYTVDTRGKGGYTGGIDDGGTKMTWKSTEHNLDIVAFFGLLATATGDSNWTGRATVARNFAVAMYDSTKAMFWAGSDPDGVSVNKDLIPEDTQSWSFLTLLDSKYSKSIEYDLAQLAATDGAFKGVSFSKADQSKVWFEGTAHLADALLIRNGAGDAAKARVLLDSIGLAQRTAPNNNGKGIVAASRDGLNTGDEGDQYFASLHTGATAWYLLALQKIDPFRPMMVARPAAPPPAVTSTTDAVRPLSPAETPGTATTTPDATLSPAETPGSDVETIAGKPAASPNASATC